MSGRVFSLSGLAGADRSRVALAFAALVLGAVAMGASPIFVRLADVGPYASAFWRCFLALPFLALWALAEKGPPLSAGIDRSVWLSGLFFAGDLFFWHLAILATTIANALTMSCGAAIISYCQWAFETKELSNSDLPFYELSIVPMLTALLRYALVLEDGHGAAPEEVFANDRVLQLLGLAWVVIFGLGVYLQ